MRRIRHLFTLFGELGENAIRNREYTTLLLVLVLLAGGLAVVVGQTAAPLVYTLF